MKNNGEIESAAEQIETRHYQNAFAANQKEVVCLALSFSKECRGLENWKIVKDENTLS